MTIQINEERLLNTFLELLEVNSPSRAEAEIAALLESKLKGLGLDVRRDDAGQAVGGNTGNIIATLPATASGGVKLLLCAHMDTVAPTEGINVANDGSVIRQTGAGVLGADDKAGVACILEAVQTAVESNTLHGQVQVLILVAEEVGLLGSKNLDMELLDADLGYVLDSGNPVGHIVTEGPSHENIIATFNGRAAHAGVCPEEGISAIAAAAAAVSRMKLGRVDSETTSNVGIISGGTARNIVPASCEVRAEARSRDSAKLQAQVEHMKQCMEQAASELGASVQIEVTRQYEGYKHPRDCQLVQFGLDAGRAAGIEPELMAHGGGSDCNILNANGLPCAVVGVGYEAIHSPDEYIPIDSLKACARMTAALVARSAGK